MSNIINNYKVSTIEQLNEVIQNQILGNIKFYGYSKHFRGQADIDFKLQTRIADKYKDSSLVQLKANQIFNSFRNAIKAEQLQSEFYLSDLNLGLYEKAYYVIFQAQHLGIPTPLMDWSFNWRNSLYFVIENENLHHKSGQLWIMLKPIIEEENVFSLNPNFHESPVLINASYDGHIKLEEFLGEKRRHNQAGEFLILPHDNCIEPLDTNKAINWPLILIEILPALKQQVYELRKKDVNDELINLMRTLRLDFNRYNNDAIYGNMNDELKKVISKTRNDFGFSSL